MLPLVGVVTALVHALSKTLEWMFTKKPEPAAPAPKADEIGTKVAATLATKFDLINMSLAGLVESDAKRQRSIDEMIKIHYDQDRKIDDLCDMHKQKDADGRPVWWFPPRMLELSQQQLDELRDISSTQKEAAMIMQSIVKDLAIIKGGKANA